MQTRTEELYQHLRDLVCNDRRRTELEARKYLLECLRRLEDRADILCHDFAASIVCFRPEDPGRYGPCDLIVVAEVVESTEEMRRRAYVWEVKAPQVHLFEHDTRNRVQPSSYLVKAENQLFHYHEDKSGSEAFRNEFGIMSHEDIVLGGVIIGRSDTILKPKAAMPLQEGERLYGTALRLRRRYIYKKNNMELMTWSNILRRLEPAKLTKGMIIDVTSSDPEIIQKTERDREYLGVQARQEAGGCE
jgi:hypothetical protein